MRDIPTIPLLPEPLDDENDPNPVTAKCECGVEWRKIMHFYCNNPRCPMQQRVRGL